MQPRGDLEFPREELRYVGDLGDGEFGQVVLMEVTGGLKSTFFNHLCAEYANVIRKT